MTWIAVLIYVASQQVSAAPTNIHIWATFSTQADCETFAVTALAATSITQTGAGGSVTTEATSSAKIVCVATSGLP